MVALFGLQFPTTQLTVMSSLCENFSRTEVLPGCRNHLEGRWDGVLLMCRFLGPLAGDSDTAGLKGALESLGLTSAPRELIVRCIWWKLIHSTAWNGIAGPKAHLFFISLFSGKTGPFGFSPHLLTPYVFNSQHLQWVLNYDYLFYITKFSFMYFKESTMFVFMFFFSLIHDCKFIWHLLFHLFSLITGVSAVIFPFESYFPRILGALAGAVNLQRSLAQAPDCSIPCPV